jgi:hypothetical protein
MPIVIDCPSCNRKLNVPETLLGQMVKCPTCGATFTAASHGPAPAPPPPPREPQPYPPANEGTGQAGWYPQYEGEQEFPRRQRTRRSGRVQEAKEAVLGPAIGLIVTGALNALCGTCDFGGRILGMNMGSISEMAHRYGADPKLAMQFNYVFMVFDVIAGPILGLIIVIGAIKMLRLEAYGFALAVSVLAVIPCTSPCILPGIPIGIWALVVLNRPEVKEAFG